jgi:hypothetical protein
MHTTTMIAECSQAVASWKDWLAPAVALIAAAAAWTGVFVSGANARRATSAGVISTSRQRWIDALRDEIAEFLTMLQSLELADHLDGAPTHPWFKLPPPETLHRLRLLRWRLGLRLNPDEAEHIEVLSIVDQLIAGAPQAVESLLARKVQAILKGEWERIKREAGGHLGKPKQ